MTAKDNAADSELSQYELKRLEHIKQNQKLLQELGLANHSLAETIPEMAEVSLPTPPRKRARFNSNRNPRRVATAAPKPTRASRRLKGEEPDDTVDLESLLDADDRVRQQPIAPSTSSQEDDANALSKDAVISVPLTLASIGTTIWSLGKLYTGKGRSKYWSGRGCRYRHPYPIGYKATKNHFGNQYTMEILEGKPGEGPEFQVQVNSSQTIFKGATPTAPWTEACKKSRSQGTRVSGPLFYGFSDLITMRLIEQMEGYDLASQPEEAD